MNHGCRDSTAWSQLNQANTVTARSQLISRLWRLVARIGNVLDLVCQTKLLQLALQLPKCLVKRGQRLRDQLPIRSGFRPNRSNKRDPVRSYPDASWPDP